MAKHTEDKQKNISRPNCQNKLFYWACAFKAVVEWYSEPYSEPQCNNEIPIINHSD